MRFPRTVLAELIGRAARSGTEARGLLAPFADVVRADATALSLYRRPTRRYPCTCSRSSPAAAQLHLVVSVLGHGVERVRLTAEQAVSLRQARVTGRRDYAAVALAASAAATV